MQTQSSVSEEDIYLFIAHRLIVEAHNRASDDEVRKRIERSAQEISDAVYYSIESEHSDFSFDKFRAMRSSFALKSNQWHSFMNYVRGQVKTL